MLFAKIYGVLRYWGLSVFDRIAQIAHRISTVGTHFTFSIHSDRAGYAVRGLTLNTLLADANCKSIHI